MPTLPNAAFVTARDLPRGRDGEWQLRLARGSLTGALQDQASGWYQYCKLQCLRSLLGILSRCCTVCRCWERGVEGVKSFHLISLFDISNYQLPTVCEVFPLFQQLGGVFPACCSAMIRLLSLAS